MITLSKKYLLFLAAILVAANALAVSINPPAGRVAVVADGNSPDPDDIGATAATIAMLRAAGLQGRLVHYSHSCDLVKPGNITTEQELVRHTIMQASCDGTASRWGGFSGLTFLDAKHQQTLTTNDLRDAINASSSTDPLWIIEAGEPDIIGYALQAADSSKRQYVKVVTHHPANDDSGDYFTWQQILDFGVEEVRIGDQNVNLHTDLSTWYWARDNSDDRIRWIWDLGKYAEEDPVVGFQHGYFDISDAGMIYYWITGANVNGGDATPTVTDVKNLLLDYVSNNAGNSYIEDSSPQLTYSGSWSTQYNPSDHGASMKWSNTAGNKVTLTFTGDQVKVVVRKGASGGICDVKLDGNIVADDVDTYANPAVNQTVIYDSGVIAYGTHTIELIVTGNKNPAANSANIMFDYFQVLNSSSVNGMYVEDDSFNISYTGSWTTQNNSSDHGGSMTWSNTAGDKAAFTFNGEQVLVAVRKGAYGGICDVKLDGNIAANDVDTYSGSAVYDVVIYDSGVISSGTHTVELIVTGNKNPASGAVNIMFDNFYFVSSPSSDLDTVINAIDFDQESHPGDDNNVRINVSSNNTGYNTNGSWIKFNGFDFGTGAAGIDILASTPKDDSSIEVRIDSPTGTLIGTVSLSNTGGWSSYQNHSGTIGAVLGVHDLYLVAEGGSGGLYNLRSFTINSN